MRRWECVLTLSLLALGAFLRLHHLDRTAFSLDEIDDIVAADRPLAEVPAAVARQTGQTPLHALMTRAVLQRFGRTETALRASPALLGVATIAAELAAGRLLFGGVSLVAAAWLAVSPAHIAASREVQSAALSGLVAVALLVAAWRLFEQPDRRRWAILVVIGTLAVYAHYGAVLIWGAVLVVVCLGRVAGTFSGRGVWLTGAAALACMILFAPWLWLDAQADRGAVMFLPRITLATFGKVGHVFAAGTQSVSVFWASALGFAALAGIVRGIRDRPFATLLITLSVLLAIAGTLIATTRLPYPFDAHQVLFVLPVWLLLVARGVEWPLTLVPDKLRPGLTFALGLAIVAAGTWVLRAPSTAAPVDWRDVAAVVGNNAWSDDAVAAPQGREALLFYAPGLTRQVLPEQKAATVVVALQHGTRGWLVALQAVRLSGIWPELSRWVRDVAVVDLSAGNDPLILYGGPTGRQQLLQEIAAFDLPSAAVARGTWLRELLQLTGPIPLTVRFVDQLATSDPSVNVHNPELLSVVALLVHGGEQQRARALARRLAQSEPDWLEAQQALAALDDPEA